jgi:hypothetical protein
LLILQEIVIISRNIKLLDMQKLFVFRRRQMIRSTLLNEITQILNTKYFSYNDFDIESLSVYDGTKVNIEYRYINNFNFSFTIPNSLESKIKVERRPGILVGYEVEYLSEKDEVLAELEDWLIAINEEMGLMPFAREIHETKTKFSILEEKFNEIPDQYFTKEEGEKLKQTLEAIELEFEQKLREELANKMNLEEEITQMKADMEQLKTHVEILSRRGWIKSFGTKLYTWGQNYPKTTALLTAMGINLLPEEIKGLIPQEELINAILPEATTETPKLVESTEKIKEEVSN